MKLEYTEETFFMNNEEFDAVKSDLRGKKQKHHKHFDDLLTQSHKKILVDILALISGHQGNRMRKLQVHQSGCLKYSDP
jgi:hypothetical protein